MHRRRNEGEGRTCPPLTVSGSETAQMYTIQRTRITDEQELLSVWSVREFRERYEVRSP